MAAWHLRILFGALLFFGAEILLWANPTGYTVLDWLVRAVGYLALGTLALDVAARYRIRSVYETMMVIAIVALLTGLLLTPESSFTDFPRTLATRVIGAHGLLSLEMFGLLLALTAGTHYTRLLLVISGVVGFFWGIWVRWSPVLIDWADGERVELMTMFAYGAVGIAIILLLYGLLRSRRDATLTPPDLRLSQTQWGGLAAVLSMLFLWQVLNETLTIAVVLVTLAIIGLCITVLWFQRAPRGRTVFDASLPPRPLPPVWIIPALVIFVAATVVGYSLPQFDFLGYNQLSVMEFAFALVGFGWFPLVAAVVGGRAIEKRLRAEQL